MTWGKIKRSGGSTYSGVLCDAVEGLKVSTSEAEKSMICGAYEQNFSYPWEYRGHGLLDTRTGARFPSSRDQWTRWRVTGTGYPF